MNEPPAAELPLRRGELQLASAVLGPGWMHEAARAHGGGDPVAGAPGAYAEARELLRTLLGPVRRRERRAAARAHPGDAAAARAGWLRRWRQVKRSVHALGGWPQWTPLEPVTAAWRRLAADLEPDRWPIDGFRLAVATEGVSPGVFRTAVAVALGELLDAEPGLHRAFIDGRTWYRRGPVRVLETVRLACDEIRPIAYAVAGLREVAVARRRALRQAREVFGHPLERAGLDLVAAWCRAGFLASPASLALTDLLGSGVAVGLPALVRGNGVPLAVALGDEIEPGRRTLGIRVDHRALDADHGGRVHAHLATEVPRLCRTLRRTAPAA